MDAKMESSTQRIDQVSMVNQFGFGWIYSSKSSNQKILLFFGNRHLTRSKLAEIFPEKKQIYLKQTHSNQVINGDQHTEIETASVIGDALFSRNCQNLIAVQTADCLPLLFVDEGVDVFGFIHAGWRGVEKQIVPHFIQSLKKLGFKAGYFQVGPHITQKNFEVDVDVAGRILATVGLEHVDVPDQNSLQCQAIYKKGNKIHIDLVEILKMQIALLGASSFDLKLSKKVDVFDDSSYWSFRRDKQSVGRNLSFVTKLTELEIKSKLTLF